MSAPDMLQFNSELRTFHIKNVSIPTSIFDICCLRTIMPPIIGKVASANIHEIIFDIDLIKITDLDYLDCEGMMGILSRPEFARLDRIEFRVKLAMKKEATRRIRAGFPDWSTRGIVHVSQRAKPTE